jgi:hypothetical protein
VNVASGGPASLNPPPNVATRDNGAGSTRLAENHAEVAAETHRPNRDDQAARARSRGIDLIDERD